MKSRYLLSLILMFFVSACGDESSEDSSLQYSKHDGKATIVFKNQCKNTIRVGRMGSGDFATLRPGQKTERNVTRDGKYRPSLAYYGYKVGQHPGHGNMSLGEFTLNPGGGKVDYYDVSFVDAFNLPMTIRALAKSCPVAGCTKRLLDHCPNQNRLKKNGKTISCTKWNDKDNPNNAAARYFENKCPKAYSWSKDDDATKGCAGQDYVLTFCPS